ncbi:MAG TPA: MFS transporter [Burkholderiales bacterium]|nr:MFS transporter [Burkholderiales bacterium]
MAKPRLNPRLPRAIWVLGFVSMLMDISSEMIHGLLPVFMVSVLGASMTTVGLVEGVGEAVASMTKLFSGWASDRLRRRKALAVLGYTLAAFTKPLFALAPSVGWVLAARFADRVGKGIRGAPRDALIGDLVPAGSRGAAFGLRQSLDTVGAVAGPLLAVALMALFADQFRLVFWLAVIPAFAAAGLLFLGVSDPEPKAAPAGAPPVRLRREFSTLGARYWWVVVLGCVLTLARFSEAFLILRAGSLGLPIALAPMVLVAMNVVYALSAYPIGVLSDHMEQKHLLVMGFVVLILADGVLAFADGLPLAFAGIALWGLHMGMTQGLLSVLVADTAPERLRATAFGLFNFASGAALLGASLLAGVLWDDIGPRGTFLAGAGITLVGLVGCVGLLPGGRRTGTA